MVIVGRHFEFDRGFKNVKLECLTHFSYIDCPREIVDMSISYFAAACPKLLHFNFSGCSKLSDETAVLIAVSLKHLREIVILRNNLISNDFLQSLTGSSLNLKRLELGGKPTEFQTKIKLEGGIEHFCDYFKN